MDNFELPHSKLFYFINQLFKQDIITEVEKMRLKELVIVEKIEIFQYLENYEDNKEEENFIKNLISLVRQKDIVELYNLDLQVNAFQQEALSDDYQFPQQQSTKTVRGQDSDLNLNFRIRVTPPNEMNN